MKFGDIVVTTELQANNKKWMMRVIPEIAIGTKCIVLKKVNLPGYDLLVIPEGYTLKVHDLETGAEQAHHSVYLFRGSWKALTP